MEGPHQTLYVNNINEKIKTPVLRKMLYMVFSQYGRVLKIVARKGVKLRGQAWIVFQDEQSAVAALSGKQGFNFYDKPLHLSFAKSASKVIGKKDSSKGTKRSREEVEGNDRNTKESRDE